MKTTLSLIYVSQPHVPNEREKDTILHHINRVNEVQLSERRKIPSRFAAFAPLAMSLLFERRR